MKRLLICLIMLNVCFLSCMNKHAQGNPPSRKKRAAHKIQRLATLNQTQIKSSSVPKTNYVLQQQPIAAQDVVTVSDLPGFEHVMASTGDSLRSYGSQLLTNPALNQGRPYKKMYTACKDTVLYIGLVALPVVIGAGGAYLLNSYMEYQDQLQSEQLQVWM